VDVEDEEVVEKHINEEEVTKEDIKYKNQYIIL
jgi:hypothetical protein